MSVSFPGAPHIEGARTNPHPAHAPNAALLVDFDNVTMGIRSDLSKELKTLLNSEVIRGKVTVQRAYADWRRYPQYIVPLSEASIDLIFAPAYGSNKKNATDIRMAIDGIELIFTRPEIGTYILLTGDSDFSSLVLKLKEYGKYVIGVGIQESASDILVQNCDEYYSYTSLSGLRKTEEVGGGPSDPWVLVERAVEQMGRRGDVMRSDRLKQVILEIDPGFDEKSLGFNKFSKFLSEASKKGVVQTRRMENGQYEILRGKGAGKSQNGGDESGSEARDRRRDRKPADTDRRRREPKKSSEDRRPDGSRPAGEGKGDGGEAHRLLRSAISDLLQDHDSDSVRDSDVKRRMLALDGTFDEAVLGFPKFSRFLQDAHDRGIVDLRKGEGGNYRVGLGAARPSAEAPAGGEPDSGVVDGSEARAPTSAPPTGRLKPREEARIQGGPEDDTPPLFEGQVVARVGATRAPSSGPAGGPSGETGGAVDPERLRLPTDPQNIVRYLTNSYGGVGEKTAETLVDALGPRLFVVLQTDPSKIKELLPPSRAERVLEGWEADFQRRRERHLAEVAATTDGGSTSPSPDAGEAGPFGGGSERPRRGRRTRGGNRPGD